MSEAEDTDFETTMVGQSRDAGGAALSTNNPVTRSYWRMSMCQSAMLKNARPEELKRLMAHFGDDRTTAGMLNTRYGMTYDEIAMYLTTELNPVRKRAKQAGR